MSYKLTYTGQQVQDYLTKVATGQVGGTDNYDTLENRPVINADLDNTAANTADQTVLYHHIGESTATYKKAALYYTNGTSWLQFKGEKGDAGTTPNITASASVNSTVGTPSVTVSRTGSNENPKFSFAFKNLKGRDGGNGKDGAFSKTLHHFLLKHQIGEYLKVLILILRKQQRSLL